MIFVFVHEGKFKMISYLCNMNFLRSMLMVAMGGAVGSAMRYLTSKVIQDWLPNAFPYGTFVVNLLGCLVIGILYGLVDQNMLGNNNLKLLLITGFCGGFTTFSTLAFELFNLESKGQLGLSILYGLASIFLSILLIYLARYLVFQSS